MAGNSFIWPLTGGGAPSWLPTYPSFGTLPTGSVDGSAAVTTDTHTLYIYSTSDATWHPTANQNTVNAITGLTGDVTATGSNSTSVAATVASVGGSTAALIHSAELSANAATNLNTASTIVKRDASGNFSAGMITANLTGNVSGNVSGTSFSFTSALSGDVGGVSSSTVVNAVGGSTAALVHTAELATNAATSAATASTIVKRDVTGSFSAFQINAQFIGNLLGNVDASAALQIGYGSATSVAIGKVGTPVSLPQFSTAGLIHNDASGLLSSSPVVNADVSASAAITRSKLAAGNPNYVAIEDGSGNLTDEQFLAKVRGGSAQDNSSITFPASGTLTTNAGTQTLTNKTWGDAPVYTQLATPSTPSAGFNKIYPKADGNFYSLSPSGTETKLGASTFKAPTVQQFTAAGAANYTPPTSPAPLYVKVTVSGAGGGGSGAGASGIGAGTGGQSTTFGPGAAYLINAVGGSAGLGASVGGTTAGGVGGTVTLGTGVTGLTVQGGTGGGCGFDTTAGNRPYSGMGGANPLGGAGPNAGADGNGIQGAPNTGAGGGGGTAFGNSQGSEYGGVGGGAGGYASVIIPMSVLNAIGTSIPLVIGTGGGGGGGGLAGTTGGAGANGLIYIEEMYQ